MQDRYAGDVGDFVKLGLLRALCGAGGDVPLRLGVNWYLAPDEEHNDDGQHVSYLRPGHTHSASLERCEPDLFRRLSSVVRSGRSVAALERAGTLPAGSLSFTERLTPMSPAARAAWHRRALDALTAADLVFLDPDVGLRVSPGGSTPHRYATMDEVGDYLRRGQTVVAYDHAGRNEPVSMQVPRRLAQLAEGTGVTPIGCVVARRGTCRFFHVVATEQHRARLAPALAAFGRTWRPHAELVSVQA